MKIKALEKRYNKLVNKTFSKRLTEQEFDRVIDQLRALEIKMLKIQLA